jgi:class 3 adenylate cyclase
MSTAGAGEVLVSGALRQMIADSAVALEDRGPRRLKGLSGEWRLHAVLRSADLSVAITDDKPTLFGTPE